LEKDFVVIAAGGGGIPIDKNGNGLEAVIDKDRASSLLATQIKADTLVFVTSVDAAYLDFGKKNQKRIAKMNLKDAKKYMEQGHFAVGSMRPKVQSAIRFIENNGKRAVICSIENSEKAIEGKAGTMLIR
jgi:carbamate kinase